MNFKAHTLQPLGWHMQTCLIKKNMYVLACMYVTVILGDQQTT